jgi:phosphatidylserine/phosphatidylglycerophosphate/cardiolipin synthase-like enzyme
VTPRRFGLSVAVLVALVSASAPGAAQQAPVEVTARVCFTPGADCTGLIVREIAKAQREILVLAYEFTSAPIAAALRDAKNQGKDVRIILDKSQRTEKFSSADFFVDAGIPTAIDQVPRIAHNKVIVIDRTIVIGGSFNYTTGAQKSNAENVTIIDGSAFAAQFVRYWASRAAVSVPYHGRAR